MIRKLIATLCFCAIPLAAGCYIDADGDDQKVEDCVNACKADREECTKACNGDNDCVKSCQEVEADCAAVCL